tara:strand:- start:70 stop:423 length:354 start_codon:yes stop_codon:yes gene_type:complete
MPKASRDKGNRREREAAKTLHEMGINARRTYSVQSAHAGNADLITENVAGRIAWEIKGCEELRMTQWLRQLEAQREHYGDSMNLLAFKQSRRPFMYLGYLDQLPTTARIIHPFLSDG